MDSLFACLVQQFRFLFVTHDEGLSVIDITDIEKAFVVADNTIEMKEAHNVFVARTYAYVAAGKEGLIIVDIEDPTSMKVYETFTDNIVDARDVVVATTNASLMGYVADGEAGLKVIQLTAPDSQPRFYGFSPEPKPETIAHYTTKKPVISLPIYVEEAKIIFIEFAFIILFYVIFYLNKNITLTKADYFMLPIVGYGLFRSNNFAAVSALVIFTIIFVFNTKINNPKYRKLLFRSMIFSSATLAIFYVMSFNFMLFR